MPTPYTGDLGSLATQLQHQLSRIDFPLSQALRATVYECVCEYVDAAKTLGWPPERVIAEVKQVAAETGFRSVASTAPRRRGADLLLDDMVAWCIERYYA